MSHARADGRRSRFLHLTGADGERIRSSAGTSDDGPESREVVLSRGRERRSAARRLAVGGTPHEVPQRRSGGGTGASAPTVAVKDTAPARDQVDLRPAERGPRGVLWAVDANGIFTLGDGDG